MSEIKREGRHYDRMREKAKEEPTAATVITQMGLAECGEWELVELVGQNKRGNPTWTGEGEMPSIFKTALFFGHVGGVRYPGAGRIWCPKVSPFPEPESFMSCPPDRCSCYLKDR